MSAEIRRSVALILMKYDDYVGAKNELLDAQTLYPGHEYIDELLKVCELAACAADDESGSDEIDWYSVLQANKSDLELKFIEMIRALEPIRNKFGGEIQSALGLIGKAFTVFSNREKRYKFKYRRADAKCVSTSQSASAGTKRVREDYMVHKEPSLECYFNNYGKANAYAVGQFWAVHDQENMPRLYARIDRIETCDKKESVDTLYLSWLKPAPINQDEKKWHEAGLPVSCGFFKLGNCKADKGNITVGTSRLVFSHLISPFQENHFSDNKRKKEYYYSEELYQLYPQKGEVWAIYKEWKPFDWCSDPKTRIGSKFQLVEILTDYSIEAGVKVAFLVKLPGYETIFRRNGLSVQVAARCLFGFSHNIPVWYAGDMGGLFSGMVLDLGPHSIPEDVAVDTVAAEFSNVDPELDGVSLSELVVNQFSCGNSFGGSDDAVNKLNGKEKVADSEFDAVSFGGLVVNESKFEPIIRGNEMAEFSTDNNPKGDLMKSVKEVGNGYAWRT